MPNQRARALRRNSTEAERRLWLVLRDRRLRAFKIRRQRPIGPFVVDFVCLEHRSVIEADGGQHIENPADETRTEWLEREGWRVIRFWNNDILKNPDGALEAILNELQPSPTQPCGPGSPSPDERERDLPTEHR
jgi:very-short-patch-repair endonuclease